jgi:hypothetical protein
MEVTGKIVVVKKKKKNHLKAKIVEETQIVEENKEI